MASGSKLFETLKLILNDLNETNNQKQDKAIDTLKLENDQLRQKKNELLSKINRPSTVVTNSIVLVKYMLFRQQVLNEMRLEAKQQSLVRLKVRSSEGLSEENSWKERLENVENMVVWPYHKVEHRIQEMQDKTCENVSIIEELKKELTKLIENKQDEIVDINLIETLRCAAEEQGKLMEKLGHNRSEKEDNVSPKQE